MRFENALYVYLMIFENALCYVIIRKFNEFLVPSHWDYLVEKVHLKLPIAQSLQPHFPVIVDIKFHTIRSMAMIDGLICRKLDV